MCLLGFAVATATVLADDPPKADAKADTKAEETKAPPKPKPDPAGDQTGDNTMISDLKDLDAEKPDVKTVAANLKLIADFAGKNRVGVNMMWTLITGFLVMFMQAGFALVETGLTRAKNVAHTMAMNFMVYALGMIGFYFVGFAIMFGGYNSEALSGGFLGGDANLLTAEYKIPLMGKEFGIFGHSGFMLGGNAFDVGIMALFLFQMVFMDTTATIPTGTMAERWKFLPFVIYGLFVSMIIYPVYGNWVWGGGWLSKLGAFFGLGHGHVDFAGSSVVHMVGGVTALAGGLIIGPRIGKYNKDGTPNALPAHSVPMYMLGTFILAFGWFGFNPGSTLAGADPVIARIAVNTMLASATGAIASMTYMWIVYKKPDPSFMCNGMLAGLVAITAPCAFVTPGAAVIIGLVSGVLVIWSCLFFERIVKVDDPVGAISVHGVNGAWGVLALGLFADGTYGKGWNGSFWYKVGGNLQWFAEKFGGAKELPTGWEEVGVTGLFYGNPSQFYAQSIGVIANLLWVFPVAFVFFWIVDKIIGNRVSAEVELQGLDVPEMGVLGYINEDPKTPEGHVTHASADPRPAVRPPDGVKRFTIYIEGAESEALTRAWSDLCKPSNKPPSPEFLAIYPKMTTMRGNQYKFRGGDPGEMSSKLVSVLQRALPNKKLSFKMEV